MSTGNSNDENTERNQEIFVGVFPVCWLIHRVKNDHHPPYRNQSKEQEQEQAAFKI